MKTTSNKEYKYRKQLFHLLHLPQIKGFSEYICNLHSVKNVFDSSEAGGIDTSFL